MTDRNYDFCDDPLNELVAADERVRELEDELAEAQSKILLWIPVSERLPEHEDDVLLYVEDYGSWITLGRRSGDGWYVNEAAEGGGPKPLDRFTHWMPLPEPPEVT
jgi:hypothetical protein